ncbi:MAG: Na+/H+ antiporter subunit E [Planctomycetes bacterium]|nr:Na+/H+ antiporter subunit E [Planctomycetota bacterium]
MRTTIWATMLFAFYLGLSGQWNNAFLVASGAVASVLVALLMLRLEPRILDSPFALLRGALLYGPWLALQVVIANLKVMRAVWLPGRVRPQVLRVPCKLRSGLGRAIYANSITLTPGTVSVLLDGDAIVVHALTPEDAEGVASGDMHDRVLALEPGFSPDAGAVA